MKKLVLILILTVFLSGCGIFNLNNFVMPDDMEFLAIVESLDTPQKICQYMQENFTYEYHTFYAPSPYILWKIREGDCNDFSTFAVFIADYHGYETYQIMIRFKGTLIGHYLGVFVENGYNYSNNRLYHPINVNTFEEVVSDYLNVYGGELNYFKVVN
ncbi:hypothetical protein KAX08_05710 [candidate division WOR-3 bacterium]|nr:hypothetical protein [candidate division WOR-3 bacterium]